MFITNALTSALWTSLLRRPTQKNTYPIEGCPSQKNIYLILTRGGREDNGFGMGCIMTRSMLQRFSRVSFGFIAWAKVQRGMPSAHLIIHTNREPGGGERREAKMS